MLLAGVLLATLAVYLRCLGNGFVYDDYTAIVRNRHIGEWSFFWKSAIHDIWWFHDPDRLPQSPYYRPLQNIWVALNFHLVGLNPAGWHLLKVTLHLCVVALSFRLVQLLTQSAATGLLTALLFGLIPVHAEAVVWAEAIPEPLAAIFQLTALCLFIRRPNTRWYGAVGPAVLFAGAVFTHEAAAVFPVIVAAYVFLFETPGEEAAVPVSGKQLSMRERIASAFARSAPFFGVSLLYMVARSLVLGSGGILGLPHTRLYAALGQAGVVTRYAITNHSFGQILATIPAVLVHYLELLLFPWLAGPAHDLRFVTTPGLSNFYFPMAILASAALLGCLQFRNGRRGRLYLFCALWWFVTLAPALWLEQISALVQDRYEYLSSLAFCLVIADVSIQIARRSAVHARAASAAAAALAVVYAGTLWHAEAIWHDDVTLFRHCVERFPDSSQLHRELAEALVRQGNYNEAAGEFAYASSLEPEEYLIHLQLGMLYLQMHRGVDAARELEAYHQGLFRTKLDKALP